MRTLAVLTLLALAAPLHAAQALPAGTTEGVIFADDRYDVVGWAGSPEASREFFVSRGFKPLGAEDLAAWLAARAKGGAYGTVAVLPTGLLPGPILQPGGWDGIEKGYLDKPQFANAAIRKYMEAGGRIVFMGDVTFYYVQGPTGPIRCAGSLLPQLADANTDQAILYGPPHHEQVLTEEGKQWGLTQPWFGMPCNTADVTQTLVAAPADKASLIFLKTLNPEYPLSGVLSFPIKLRADEVNLPLLTDIYKAANYWGKPVKVPEVTAAVKALPDLEVSVSLGDGGTRSVYLPEERISGLVTVTNRKPALAGRLAIRFSDAGGTYFSEEKPLGVPSGEVPARLLSIPTEGLRRGEYKLEAVFTGEAGQKAERSLRLDLVRKPDNPFFLGIWGQLPANTFRREQYLTEIGGYHLNPVCSAGYDDDLLRRGMRFVQRIEAYEGFANAADDKDASLLRKSVEGKPIPNPWRPALFSVSIAHPQVIAGWSEGQREQIRELTRHPAWFPTILTCDDFSAYYGEDFGDYSGKLFTERTGKAVPQADPKTKALPAPPKGIIADDDLRLLWREHTVKELGGFANRSFTRSKEEVAPRVPFGPVPGGMMIPVWTEGQYPPAAFGSGAFDLLSYYYYNAYWQPEIGNLYWDEAVRMGNRNLPLWSTPDVYIAGDEPSYYRNAFFLHLAGGVSGLNYYAYSEHKPAAIKEVGRLAERLEELAALQVALRPAARRVGMYLPLACSAVDWSYPLAAMYAYSNLLCAHVDVEPVCREELLGGAVYGYEALVLWNADWLGRAEAEGLKRYLARGGKVYLDKASAVDLPGATRLPLDLAMGKLDSALNNDDPRFAGPGQADYNVADRVTAVRAALGEYVAYDAADPNVITRAFTAEGATYVWCANVHTNEEYKYLVERMPVYKRDKDRAAAEEEGRKFLRERGAYDKLVQTTLTLPASTVTKGLAVYDVWAGKRLALTVLPDGRATVPLTMERLGGTLLGLYSSAPAKVTCAALPAAVKRGEWGALDIRVYGENGLLMNGLLPCRLSLLDPQGQRTFTQTLAVRDGRHVMRFAPARNDTVGKWTVEMTELAGGTIGQTAVIEVK